MWRRGIPLPALLSEHLPVLLGHVNILINNRLLVSRIRLTCHATSPLTDADRGTSWGTTLAKLTVRRIETAKGPAKLTDEHGLYLRVSPRGAESWIQRLNIQGLRTDNAIGHYPALGLAEARAAAFERWKIAKGGGDPPKADGKTVLAPTFAEAAEAVIAMHEPTWRSPSRDRSGERALRPTPIRAWGKRGSRRSRPATSWRFCCRSGARSVRLRGG